MENNTEGKSMLTPKDGCIFCSIAYGKTNQTVCFETNDLVIFHDHLPKAQYHFQCVPKKHIRNAKYLTHEDIPLVMDMMTCGKNYLTSQLKLDPDDFLFGFHWPPFNSVHHLHMHILGPKQLMSFNLMFDPRFHIFRKVERVLDDLKKLKIERKK
ncbi:Histidine triad nucleotide-binding protein 3 [Schistosoma haematobium]|uniref:Adenosine 5'-monophosphoramidase HINT3 n=1 Tax=Schistosoma haematobium TaxID=6185 RepID=A0A922IRS4_SCHHA|nr:Histidine triad nucleotide-binding protein 3 [Schistosoma haematobium]KAH9585573.1 Histidine triad nucleotide-binding protein 3 [Schistosoma haematobium]CAH8522756.1 unnamed protein product [Schistosoma haematobium]CAH8525864.1 unnamed protein product [Schistosoma haematobium]